MKGLGRARLSSYPASPEIASGDPIVQVSDLAVRFGAVKSVDGVDLHISPGECVGLIGPNGAGKTTTMNCISGFIRPNRGRISIFGSDFSRLSVQHRAKAGVGRTFQNLELFTSLSVRENLLCAVEALPHKALPDGARRGDRLTFRNRVTEILETLGISEYGNQKVEVLPHGVRKMVELGRALASNPRLLLLDEPATGLTRPEKRHLADQVRAAQTRSQTSILLVEHDMSTVEELCQRVYVLDAGRVIFCGEFGDAVKSPDVITAYLGAPVATGS